MLGIDENLSRELGLSKPTHVSVVVRDLDKAIKAYSSIFGVGPFSIYPPEFYREYMSDMTFRGKPVNYTMKISVTDYGPIQLELIQPLEGKSTYSEFLEKKGEGLHHLGYAVSNLDASLQAFKKIGVDVLMSARGRASPTGFAYMDTEPMLGFVVEIGEADPHWSDFLKYYCNWDLNLSRAKASASRAV